MTAKQFNVLVDFSYTAVVPIWAEDQEELDSIIASENDDEWFDRADWEAVKFQDKEAIVISVEKVD